MPRPPLRKLADLKLGAKLAVGLSALVLVLLALGGKSLWTLDTIEDAFLGYEKAARQVERTDTLKLDFAGAIGAAKEYVARNTQARFEATLARFDAVSGTTARMAEVNDGAYGSALE